MRTAIIAIVVAVALAVLLSLLTPSHDRVKFNMWSDRCRKAGGFATIKAMHIRSTTYECLGIDGKALGVSDVEY